MALQDNFSIPTSFDGAVGNIIESAPMVAYVAIGTIFGGLFAGSAGSLVGGVVGVVMGYRHVTGEHLWEGI